MTFFFLIEPVATEHQSHLLVLDVLLRINWRFAKVWITENISYWYFMYSFLWLSKIIFVLIESRLYQCNLVTTAIHLGFFPGMLAEWMFYLIYTISFLVMALICHLNHWANPGETANCGKVAPAASKLSIWENFKYCFTCLCATCSSPAMTSIRVFRFVFVDLLIKAKYN